MNVGDISFPNLGIYLSNVPYGFYVGNFFIAFYGVFITIGVLAGINIAAYLAKKSGQNPDHYWDFAIYAVVFSIIGARVYYVIFSWKDYRDKLIDIFKIRQGGLAIYGGVIAAFTTLFIYNKIKKTKALVMGDTSMAGLVMGQVIGRWGNFMNREVFGEYTNNIFAMRIPVEAVRDAGDITENIRNHMMPGDNFIQVHPTFLYESLLNLCLFCAIVLYFQHKKFDGEICLLYLGGYGIIRFFVEGIRTDQLHLGDTGIAVSQVLGISLFVFAVVVDVVVRIRMKNNPKVEKIENNEK